MSSNEPSIDAVVKWFKNDKGFGFVELGNGTGDAFCISAPCRRRDMRRSRRARN